MKSLIRHDDSSAIIEFENQLLRFIHGNSCVDTEFLVWFLDQIRGVERFTDKEQTFSDILISVSDLSHVDSRFTTPRFIRMLSGMPLFEYRINARVGQELKLWKPFQESFRGFCCKVDSDRFNVWHDPEHSYTFDDIYTWLKGKHEEFISKRK